MAPPVDGVYNVRDDVGKVRRPLHLDTVQHAVYGHVVRQAAHLDLENDNICTFFFCRHDKHNLENVPWTK